MRKNNLRARILGCEQLCKEYLKIHKRTLFRWLEEQQRLLEEGRYDEAEKIAPRSKRYPGRRARVFLEKDVLEFLRKNRKL
ncbi:MULTISPECIES: hypothetical protein [Idiomarina]|uniref:hypothetical protein n=1 Tax=Idiomarina TaxID=135575 RepID=UPI000C3BAA91|nr:MULTISPECIES: hypothetical protein [Idiomarina]MBP59439.1 hypothetical protein [Idiomarina sp.]